ncbi:MAG: hypothetical protein LBK47_02870 [Prevotellaceae bacterium]|jgi:hypothetical protein|nr:hypothetical protein [Prevotellaceae bacterium]
MTLRAAESLCIIRLISAAELNLAGGLVCETVGVVPVNKKQLLEECLKKL